jgi:hypothetical protein
MLYVTLYFNQINIKANIIVNETDEKIQKGLIE